MFNKNNVKNDNSQAQQRFSIKKFKFGAASVLVGLAFLGLGGQSVLADEAGQAVTDEPATAVTDNESSVPAEPVVAPTPQVSANVASSNNATSVANTEATTQQDSPVAQTAPTADVATVETANSLASTKIGEEVAFPKELAGTWTAIGTPHNAKVESLVISEDGTYSSKFPDGSTIHGNMLRLRKVSENGFVMISDPNGGIFSARNIGGAAGPNAKWEFGFILEGNTLSNVVWSLTIGAEDYSNPFTYVSFVKANASVSDKPVATDKDVTAPVKDEASTTQSTVKAYASTTNYKAADTLGVKRSVKAGKALPQTGENSSKASAVLGMIAVAAGAGLVAKKSRQN